MKTNCEGSQSHGISCNSSFQQYESAVKGGALTNPYGVILILMLSPLVPGDNVRRRK